MKKLFNQVEYGSVNYCPRRRSAA